MNKVFSNVCPRCGKERVFLKKWKEKVGYSVVVTTETTCPDIKCQKIVNQNNEKQRAKQNFVRQKRQASLSRNGKSKRATKK